MNSNDKYQYDDLSDNAKSLANKELNENPDQVNAHIESFRRWLKSMNYLTCPQDAKFLLRFLRVSKFDHSKAQKRLDNFCTVRASPRGSPEFFDFFDVNDASFQKFLKMKCHLPLGKCDNGESVLLVRPTEWKIEDLPMSEMAKCIFMDIDMITSDEDIQIHGIKILIDMTGVNRKVIEAWADPKFSKKWSQIMQDSYPMRNKGQIFYNEPMIFDIAFQIVSFFMSDKMKSRTFRVKDDMKKAMDKVPGLEKVLPTEYGGKGGSIESISKKFEQQLNKYFKNGNPLASIRVDESKRPSDMMKNLKEYGEYKGPTLGTQGTYTKYDNVY